MLITDDDIHVWFDAGLMRWKATGKEGDYGMSVSRGVAIQIASDAAVTRHPSLAVTVHTGSGRIYKRITQPKGIAMPQFFQDNVE